MKITLQEVPEEVYEQNFNKIYDWFTTNVHVATVQGYTYKFIDLKNDYRRMYDIISDESGLVHFRVIIKVTKEDVTLLEKPTKDYKDLAHFETVTDPKITGVTARQVCWIQLNEEGEPINDTIVTYAPADDKNHVF